MLSIGDRQVPAATALKQRKKERKRKEEEESIEADEEEEGEKKKLQELDQGQQEGPQRHQSEESAERKTHAVGSRSRSMSRMVQEQCIIPGRAACEEASRLSPALLSCRHRRARH